MLLRGGRPVGAPGVVERTGTIDVLVRRGRVAAMGPDLDLDPAALPADLERVDLAGRTVLRGLRDAHVHFSQWALSRQRLDVSGARSAAGATRLVVERLRARPPAAGAALVGSGFRDGLWPDVPTAGLLDDALRAAGLPDTAVVLVSGDWHCAWLSSAALVRYGVRGHPTGLLREGEWFGVSEAVSAVPAPVLDAWVDEAARAAAARGVVSITDYELADNTPVWRRRIAAGTDSLRVAASTWPPYLDLAVEAGFATGDVVPGTRGLLTMGPLKVISDGSLNTRTAYCHDPYPVSGGGAGEGGTGVSAPGGRGTLSVGPAELRALMARATASGLTCAIHAIGDLANGLALDAFAATGARGSIEHAQLLSHADLPRFAELGVVASIQPEHALDDRDVADRYWPGRTDRAFAFADLLAAGAELALGSDAPVAPLDPWLAIAAAVHRTRGGRAPWHPEQSIALAAALAASSGGRSVPAVGDVADLAIVDLDPAAADAEALRTIPVSGTLLAGRWTWCTLER